MRKVVVVHGQLTHGGSERQLYYLLRHRDRSAFDVHLVLSGAKGYWADPISKLDVPITLLQGSPVAKLLQFRRLVRRLEADTVLSWSSYTNILGHSLIGMPVRRVGSFRNVKFEDTRYFKGLFRLAKLRGNDRLICNSQETHDSLKDDLGPAGDVVYVANGTDLVENAGKYRVEWRSRLGIDADEKLIVGVGRIGPQKNFGRFIDTIAALYRQMPCRAVIAGSDFGVQEGLEQQIDGLDLPAGTIRFLGEVDDARELIAASDALLLSSDFEGMPNVVMEAMAAGVPCVTTPVNGVDVLIEHGVHGMLGGWTVESLVEPLLTLLSDDQLAAEVGRNGRERIRTEFSPKISAEKIWNVV